MNKPKLQNSALPSTAISKNLLSATYLPLHTTSLKPSMRDMGHPIISSFYKGSMKKEQTADMNKIITILQKEKHSNDQSIWINTSDIESIINKRIEADAELSIQRNFATQKYFLGPERICTQKILPIPTEIRDLLSNRSQQQQHQKIHLVYGYLSLLHAVYYIVGQDLFIYSMDDLKKREQERFKQKIFQQKTYKRTKLRPNCRKIYEVDFPLSYSSKLIPKQFQGKVLILQYPYEIQLCCYLIDQRTDYEKHEQKEKDRNFVTLVSLDVRIPLETISAQFITVTQKGQLLYLDEKGHVICFQFSKTDDTKLKRKTHQQSSWKKKTFISRNKSFISAAKNYFWQILDFRHSLYLPKKKNFCMIYDERRNRIYTLTIRGDRQTIIQEMKKEIRIYEFLDNKKVELNCIWSISEKQLLAEIGIEQQKHKLHLFSILKAEPDYNQQSDLIALLSNGTKIHLQIRVDNLKINWLALCPDIDAIKNCNRQRNQNLLQISNTFMSKDTNNQISRKWSQRHEIKRYQNNDLTIKAFFNDRSISIGLVKVDKQVAMYMTSRRYMKNSDQFDVFPIEWKKGSMISDVDKFPSQNEIFMARNWLKETSLTQQLTMLQKEDSLHQQVNRQLKKKAPHPMTINCHDYLRQVHYSPHSFTYLSNKFITSFTFLRPIDILHLMITTRQQLFCEMYLPAILSTQPFEICCMLLQLYSAKDGKYYVSSNYKLKINLLIQLIKKNTQRYQSVSDKSILAKMTTSETFVQQQKKIFQRKDDDELQVFAQTIHEQTKSKIRRLYVSFSKLQQIQNPNPFEKIKINFHSTSTSSQAEENIEKLTEEKKGQAQYCLLYISRVVYPFWKAKITSCEQSRKLLKSMHEKLTELFSVVDLLKIEGNEYWKHLKNFISKLLQIVQMFQMIHILPQNLTLQEAVTNEPSFFEPFIFTTLRRQTGPEMIKLFQDRFPIYISKYFETLVKIFIEARMTSNLQQIKALLGRLPEYPDYFLDFLKEQKGFSDLTFLKVKDQLSHRATTLNLPDLPFESLIQHLHNHVNSSSIEMDKKFLYLKEARKKMNLYKSPQNKNKEVFSPHVLQSFQKQYDSLFKCLKLQQEIKKELIREIREKQNSIKISSSENSSIIDNILSKFSFKSENLQNQQQNRLNLGSLKQKQKVYEGSHQQLFRTLNYKVFSKSNLQDLITQMKCPRLTILYCSMFSGRGINQQERQRFYSKLFQSYSDIVKEGVQKLKIEVGIVEGANISKLINHIRRQISQIYQFLNKTKTPLAFSPLYEGIKEQMIKHQFTLKAIVEKSSQFIFSVGRQLVQLGFDKNIVLNHIILQNLPRIFTNSDIERQDLEENNIKSWIYDWFMAVDVAKKCKIDQLDSLRQLAKDILEFKPRNFAKLKQYKNYLESQIKTIFDIINGCTQNEMGKRTILNKIMANLK